MVSERLLLPPGRVDKEVAFQAGAEGSRVTPAVQGAGAAGTQSAPRAQRLSVTAPLGASMDGCLPDVKVCWGPLPCEAGNLSS